MSLTLILAVIALLPAAIPPARAYGSTALWQIGLSFNCDNQALCLQPPFGIGGFWGWVEFDTGSQGDATLTGCSHLSTSLNVLTGADHLQVNITGWTITSHPFGPPTFVLTDGTVSFTGVNTKGSPVTVTLAQSGIPPDTGFPAIPGHFSAQSIFGFQAPPGMNFEIQVVQLTN
jgi:hypothetical protein